MSTSISICAADEVDLAQAETPAEIFLNQSTANIESIYCSEVAEFSEYSSPKQRRKRRRRAERNARIKLLSLPTNMASYQICGGNGGPIVDAYLNSLGWKKIADKQNFNWKLKWIEVNGQVNYGAFRDGEQLVNRIPNCSLLTNKLGLYNSLSEYSRVVGALKGDRVKLKMSDFVPETYRIDQLKDRETFLDVYKDGEIWICKPTGLNQGKGIFLIRSQEQIDKMLADREQRKQARRTKPLMPLIVQRYIEKPLLVERKKFDIRAYMMIPSTLPFIVLYHKGYVRVTCEEYNLDSLDLSTHLTNQYVQKKVENYKDMKEDTVWSMEKFNQYVNETVEEEKGIETDWVLNHFEKQIKAIMKYCFNSVKHKLQSRLGLFDIYGFDFMIDSNMKIWLIEINVNPAMHVNCEVLKENLPGILAGTIDLALECFEKAKKNQPLLPLQNLGTFHMLYNACPKSASASAHQPTSISNSLETQSNPSGDKPSGGSAQTSSPPHKTSQSPVRSRNVRLSQHSSREQGWGYRNRSPVKSSKETGESQSKSLNCAVSKAGNGTVTGTNYIKNNIANLGTLASRSRRTSRVSRVEYAGIVSSEDLQTAPYSHNTDSSVSVREDVESDALAADNPPVATSQENTASYHKPLANAAPQGPQQISARARGTAAGTAADTGLQQISGVPQQTATIEVQSAIPDWKTSEQILRELREFRPKTPLLPPLYTIRSDVATSRVLQSQGHLQRPDVNSADMSLQGYPAISTAEDRSPSPVRLSMVHAAYAPGKSRTRGSSFTTVSRAYPRDRAS